MLRSNIVFFLLSVISHFPPLNPPTPPHHHLYKPIFRDVNRVAPPWYEHSWPLLLCARRYLKSLTEWRVFWQLVQMAPPNGHTLIYNTRQSLWCVICKYQPCQFYQLLTDGQKGLFWGNRTDGATKWTNFTWLDKNFDISFVYISPVGLDKKQFSLFNIIADFFWYMIGGATLLANLKLTR